MSQPQAAIESCRERLVAERPEGARRHVLEMLECDPDVVRLRHLLALEALRNSLRARQSRDDELPVILRRMWRAWCSGGVFEERS